MDKDISLKFLDRFGRWKEDEQVDYMIQLIQLMSASALDRIDKLIGHARDRAKRDESKGVDVMALFKQFSSQMAASGELSQIQLNQLAKHLNAAGHDGGDRISVASQKRPIDFPGSHSDASDGIVKLRKIAADNSSESRVIRVAMPKAATASQVPISSNTTQKSVFQRLSDPAGTSERAVIRLNQSGKAVAAVAPTDKSNGMPLSTSRAITGTYSVKERLGAGGLNGGSAAGPRVVQASNLRLKQEVVATTPRVAQRLGTTSQPTKARIVPLKRSIFDRLGS